MYHAEHGARLFETADALDKAGNGWVDHPEKAAQVGEPAKRRGRPPKAERNGDDR